MRSAVLGGSGFIGRHLVKRLSDIGQQVSVFARTNIEGPAKSANLQFFRGDFSDGQGLREALNGIDHCYHLISTTTPGSSNRDPFFDIDTNLKGTIRFLEIAISEKVKKVILCSSGGTIYGLPKTVPIDEDHPLWPINSYGIVKAAIERYLNLFLTLRGLEYGIARVSNAYGEGQQTDKALGAVTVFAERALRGQEVEIWGDGSVVRDFVHVEDAVRGLIAVANHDGPDRVFNIGSGQGHSLNELLLTIERILGRPVKVKYSAARRFDVPVNVLSIARAEEKLSWSPRISLEEGLRRTLAWLKSDGRREDFSHMRGRCGPAHPAQL